LLALEDIREVESDLREVEFEELKSRRSLGGVEKRDASIFIELSASARVTS
jgi:hypothetical protein